MERSACRLEDARVSPRNDEQLGVWHRSFSASSLVSQTSTAGEERDPCFPSMQQCCLLDVGLWFPGNQRATGTTRYKRANKAANVWLWFTLYDIYSLKRLIQVTLHDANSLDNLQHVTLLTFVSSWDLQTAFELQGLIFIFSTFAHI